VALSLPPPEQLGIGGQAASDIDLNDLYHRLDDLGAQSTEVRRTAEGYRFTCLLATTDGSRTQRINADGASRTEAARVLLARAQQWAQQK
jgi:hypothetical protein